MLELSIILPTCNRAALLKKSLAAISAGLRRDHEIIVVDGASTDDTPNVLTGVGRKLGERLRVIREQTREGFVKAANKGFAAARGRNMIWLNDDARPLPGSLDLAIDELDSLPADVGFVALFHRWHSTWNVAYETIQQGKTYRLCHIRGTLYANFAMGRRQTYERLGYFDERYYFNAADPDLSLKAWHAGLTIAPAWSAMVDHDELEDDRRTSDSILANEDNDKLFAKWDLPPKNPYRNDFDPARPCTLRGLRQEQAAAA